MERSGKDELYKDEAYCKGINQRILILKQAENVEGEIYLHNIILDRGDCIKALHLITAWLEDCTLFELRTLRKLSEQDQHVKAPLKDSVVILKKMTKAINDLDIRFDETLLTTNSNKDDT